MGIIQNIINRFKQGGARMGFVANLNQITDHPKIGVNPNEYKRIEINREYFRGIFPDVKYRNSYGERLSRPYTSLNMAKVVSKTLASMMFNEKMEFSISKTSETDEEANQFEAADKFVHEFLNQCKFMKSFEVYLESMAALGGLALRPSFENGKPSLSYIQAPSFYPLHSNTTDVPEAAIAIKTTRTEGNEIIYYTLLEFHEWVGEQYVITNELYRSETKDECGVKVALNSLEEYKDLQPTTLFTGLSRPQFVYIKPFGMNNKDIDSPLGLSIYDNARNTLKQINDAYDQFNWEVKMGQRRVSVNDSMLEGKTDLEGNLLRVFDTDQNVYVSSGDDADGAIIKDLTTPIRANDYINSINHFLKMLEVEISLSAGTFSFDGQSVKTATEIVSENSLTFRTRNSHLNNVEQGLKELMISILELAKGTIGINGKELYTGEIPSIDDITISFDDGIFFDKNAQLDYWLKAKSGGAASAEMVMQRALGLTEEQANEVIQQIQAESAPTLGALDTGMYGGN